MLISQIVPIDANAQRFATDHVTSLLAPSGGSDFDTYLARVMQRESTPGAIAQAADPYHNDPYTIDRQSPHALEAYRSDTARAADERAAEATEKREKNRVDRKKVDEAAADEATARARDADDAAREERSDAAHAAGEGDEATQPTETTAADQPTDKQSAQAAPQAEAEGEAATDAEAKKAAPESAHAAAAAGDAGTKAAGNEANAAGAKSAANGAQAAGEAGNPTGKSRAGEAADAAARSGAAAAKAGEAAAARSSDQAGATVELEVNLEEAVKDAAEEASQVEAQERAGGEAEAKDAQEEAATKASLRGGRLSREATVAAAGSEAAGRGDEARDTGDHRREQAKQAKIDVTDLRAKGNAERAASEQTSSNANRDQGGSHQHSSTGENGSRNFADLLGGEGARAQQGATRGLTNPTLNRAADQLSRQLNENLNSEIVRQAKFIVRTNESGEIKLHLRPESLGSVRIALQMQDGHIAGRIIVDNQTVREVFEHNLASLERAFLEQGLETGGLDVTVADSGGQGREQGEPTRGHGTTKGRGQTALAGAVPTIENYETHELVDVTV